jgi:antitoxin component YwqK of YwqJK toxin-antitoxin module
MNKYFSLLWIICVLQAESVFTQENGIKEGYNRIYYPNGKISSEGTIRNGKPDGFWKNYYPTGVLRSEGNRRNHLLDSTWVFYNEMGDTVEKVNFAMGKRNGYSISYNTYDSGDPMNKGRVIARELYVNDCREGKSIYYYPNGQIKEDVNYKNNKRDGISREFDLRGNLITILQYNNGLLTERERINRLDKEGLKQGIWKTFYENGRLKTEAYYTDNLLNGAYKEYNENGNVSLLLQYQRGALIEKVDTGDIDIEIRNRYDNMGNVIFSGSFRNNIPVGIHRNYNSSGNVTGSILYDDNGIEVGEGIIQNDGKKEGDWTYFYKNGSVKSKGIYVNNQESGKWKYYFENGKVEQTGEFKNGKAEGLWEWYYPDGKIKREEEYYNGNEEGQVIEYDTSGNVLVKGTYFDGQREGDWFYHVGDYIEKGKYIGDLKDGKWEAFYEDGSLKYEGNYIQGNPDGEHVYYYQNGQIKEENYYIMGIREKNWRKYDENGILLITITYKDNNEYRINGQRIDFAKDDIRLIQ